MEWQVAAVVAIAAVMVFFGLLMAASKWYRKTEQGKVFIRNGINPTVSFTGVFVVPIIHRLEINKEATKSNLDVTSLPKDITVKASVYLKRRLAIQRHHSATHIVNWALREVLGNHIRQAGSLVTKERLRFDFAHYEAMSAEQLAEVEQMVNEAVIANSGVKTYETPYDQKPDDVVAVFGEKYGAVVRVVDIGGFSKELCGGTHVQSTGEIGLIKIVSESSIATGTRRIEAVCGATAASLMCRTYDQLHEIANTLKCQPEAIGEKLESLFNQRKEAEKELKRLQQKAAANQARELATKATDLAEGLKALVSTTEAPNPNELKNMATALGQKLGESVVVLAAEFGDKISVVAVSSPHAIEQGHKAGDIVRDLTSKLGGKGGGKPNFAMGGAPNDGKLADVIENYFTTSVI